MHSMSIAWGPTMADGTSWGASGIAGLPGASTTYNQEFEFFAFTFSGATIVGATNAFYAGSDGLTIGGATFTWQGYPQLIGINEVDIVFAAATASPASGTMTVAGTNQTITTAGTYTWTLSNAASPLTIGATPAGWQMTSLVIKYTCRYADGSLL